MKRVLLALLVLAGLGACSDRQVPMINGVPVTGAGVGGGGGVGGMGR